MIFGIIGGALLVALAVGCYVCADYFFKKSFERPQSKDEIIRVTFEKMRKNGQERYADEIEKGMDYLQSLDYTDEYTESYDGLRLHAKFYKNGDSRKTVIMAHGFRGVGEFDFSCAFDMDRSLGYNILLIDERAHGESEGRYICFGVKERYDIISWCGYLISKDPGCEIVLSGISMGASTVLLAAGLDTLPENVKGITADCGYVSPYEEIVHVMKTALKLPKFPLLYIANGICRHRAGYGFDDVSTLDAVKKIKIPVLFIHGEADGFVPYSNSVRNFEACVSEKKRLLSVKNADHGLSFLEDNEKCRREITDFFNNL